MLPLQTEYECRLTECCTLDGPRGFVAEAALLALTLALAGAGETGAAEDIGSGDAAAGAETFALLKHQPSKSQISVSY